MNIRDLLKECKIDDYELEDILHSNPKQFLSEELKVPIWKVEYSYLTARNNPKQGIKYLFLQENDWDIVDNEFNKYIEEFNNKFPHKKLLNVEVLDCEYVGHFLLPIYND